MVLDCRACCTQHPYKYLVPPRGLGMPILESSPRTVVTDPFPALSGAPDNRIPATQAVKRAKNCTFDPTGMSAFQIDQKVRDIERARYWSNNGFNFNFDHMTAFMMDQKVRDIERAQYWKTRGFDFNPDHMTAFTMDQQVANIRRVVAYRSSGR